MNKLVIDGGYRLTGEVTIQGTKNGVLPIMAAAILNKGITVIHNCPMITDVFCMGNLLRSIGCVVAFDKDTVMIDASYIDCTEPDVCMCECMRASVLLMGALLGRMRSSRMAYPGGCIIGARPIDMHLDAFTRLGAQIDVGEKYIGISAKELVGSDISFAKISVGATQNAILAAVLANGNTTLRNVALEPEVCELCHCLNMMGANIKGIGSRTLYITGVNALHDVVFRPSSDRIVAGTYMMATIGTMGDVTFLKAPVEYLGSVILRARRMGAKINVEGNTLTVHQDSRPRSLGIVRTRAYPGFPTDMQSQIMSVLAVADGKSVIREEIFENRFMTVPELNRMQARINIDEKTAYIYGVNKLAGTKVVAKDLRGGAALVVAGLIARGMTTIEGMEYVRRGYVDICSDLKELGAHITWKKD